MQASKAPVDKVAQMTGRILIVDPVATNRIVMRVKLSAAFYEVIQAARGADACTLIDRLRPDLIITSDVLPDMTGAEFCSRIKAMERHGDLPVILVHAQLSATQRLAVLAAGADDVLARPLDDLVMLARLRSLLRARNAESELRLRDDTQRALGLAEEPATFTRPAQVVLVSAGPEHDMARLMNGLRPTLPDRIAVSTPEEILRNRVEPADVFVIAESVADSSRGLGLLSELRAGSTTRHAAIVYIAGAHQRQSAATALDLGANDLMIGPLDPPELALRLQKQIARKRTSERLRATMHRGVQAALIDPLTGLYNRRYALPHLARLAENAAQKQRPFAVMIADLDHFKRINDLYGHAAGDAVLIEVARRLSDNLRAADLLARFGGEEFLIVMPDTPRELARVTASRLCRLIGETPFALPGQDAQRVTVSIGVSIGGLDAPATLLEMADRALYGAKADGRNKALLNVSSAA